MRVWTWVVALLLMQGVTALSGDGVAAWAGDGVVRVADSVTDGFPELMPPEPVDGWYEFGLKTGYKYYSNLSNTAHFVDLATYAFPPNAKIRLVGGLILNPIPAARLGFSEVDMSGVGYVVFNKDTAFDDGRPFLIPSGGTGRYQPATWKDMGNNTWRLTSPGGDTFKGDLAIEGLLTTSGDNSHLSRATFSGNDGFNLNRSAAVSGGTLSMLWHAALGPVSVATLGSFFYAEPHNMQDDRHDMKMRCLAPRLVKERFSNIFDYEAKTSGDFRDGVFTYEAKGKLTHDRLLGENIRHQGGRGTEREERPFSFIRTVTVGFGISPNQRSHQAAHAGFRHGPVTAGGDFHPALSHKILICMADMSRDERNVIIY